jgi:hypothetical protein
MLFKKKKARTNSSSFLLQFRRDCTDHILITLECLKTKKKKKINKKKKKKTQDQSTKLIIAAYHVVNQYVNHHLMDYVKH